MRILILIALLAGCASPEVLTEAKDCEAQGGCVVVSWGAIDHLAKRAHLTGLQP